MTAGPVLALLLALASCGDDGPTDSGDKTPPTVQSVDPADGSSAVTPDTVISIDFSEAIAAASVNSSSLTTLPPVSGQITVDSARITLTPDAPLTYGTTYEVTIGTAVTDLAGNGLAQPYAWSFSVVDDPATTIPYVTNTVPASNATDVDASLPIQATFSKTIDPSSLTTASFSMSPATAGTVTCTDSIAVFTPADTLDYNTTYTASLTTAVADTFGNHLASPYSWIFVTGDDPYIPRAFVTYPFDNAIVGDTVTLRIMTQHPVGVTRVEFYVDNVHQVGDDDSEAPFEFTWDASGMEIGSEHTLSARAYDEVGRVGYSDTVKVTYLWEEIATDPDDDQRVDIFRIFARSSDTLLELRYEFWEDWTDPANDTALDLGIFLDTDQNGQTGFTHFTSDGVYLNDIGAEYRVIIGAHGYEAWSSVAPGNTSWIVLGGPESLAYYNVPADTNIMEIGLRWEEMGFPTGLSLVCNNVFFLNTSSIIRDWVPNQGNGHLTITRSNRFVGETYPLTTTPRPVPPLNSLLDRSNPFE